MGGGGQKSLVVNLLLFLSQFGLPKISSFKQFAGRK